MLVSRVTGRADDLKAGRYIFTQPIPLWEVVTRMAKGEYGTKVRKVTIPEGSSNAEISKIVGVSLGHSYQGYLFPDTYFFDQYSTDDEIRAIMMANFQAKVIPPISFGDLILASLVEEEASSTLDRKLIAGILEKRLKLGMPLQVDVALETYDRIGLPDEPIVNPGLDAIDAVRNPTSSKYLYYLSDKEGITHYAVTFEEHKRNRERYGI